METNLVYITAGSLAEARAIGKELVSNRLAACVNILDHMRSVYRWEGDVKEDEEVVVIAKTKALIMINPHIWAVIFPSFRKTGQQ